MSDLSPEAARLLADARAQAPHLDRRAHKRVKQAVLLSVAAPSAAAAASKPLASFVASTAGKVVVGVAAAVVGASATLGVMPLLSSPRGESVAPSGRVRVSEPSEHTVTNTLQLSEPEPTPPSRNLPSPREEKVAPSAGSGQATGRVKASAPSEHTVTETPELSAPKETRERTITDPPEAGPREPRAEEAALREELTLLHAAMAQHDAQQWSAALSTLSTYDARFPAGTLATEARALRVLVLCELARDDEAKVLAGELRQAAPDSPAVRRLTKSCAGP